MFQLLEWPLIVGGGAGEDGVPFYEVDMPFYALLSLIGSNEILCQFISFSFNSHDVHYITFSAFFFSFILLCVILTI